MSPKCRILDATPETPNHEPNDDASGNLDSPLQQGRTFSYKRYGLTVHITNLSADPETGKLKLHVAHGDTPGNTSPVGVLLPSQLAGTKFQKIYFTADVIDHDGDDIAYHWTIPDATAPLPNARTIEFTFDTLGQRKIECICSDMHGGISALALNFDVIQNQPPTISAISDQTIDEDTSLSNLAFTVSDPTTPAANIVVTATSQNTSLVPNAAISITSAGGGNRRISITPPPNRHGDATISVVASDGQLTRTEKFVLHVTPVTPGTVVVAKGADWSYWDSATAPAGGWFGTGFDDSAWKSDSARFVYNQGFLVPAAWTKLADAPGRVTCYFRKTFGLRVLPEGTPTLKLLCDDAAVVYLNGVEVWRQNLPDDSIKPNTPAILSIEGTDESEYTLVPLAAGTVHAGSNTLAVEVHDRTAARGIVATRAAADVSFDAELALLEAPTLSTFRGMSTPEDTTLGPVTFTALEAESPSGGVAMTAVSSNQDIVLDGDIVFSTELIRGRSFKITPRPNATGDASITLKASDGSSETWSTFNLRVTPVNDAPTIAPIPAVVTALGELVPAIPIRVDDIDTPVASLVVTASSSDAALLPASGIQILPGDEPGLRWLNLTPTDGVAAQGTVTVLVSDGALSAQTDFTFRVSTVQDVTSTPVAFIQSGDDWRYWIDPLPLDDRGNPIDWTDSRVSIRGWRHGGGALGYGNSGLVTTVPATPFRVTTYFRRSIVIPDPSAFANFQLRLLRDDGAVVYLNGAVIHTSNMPRGPVTSTTLAASDIDGRLESSWETVAFASLPSLRPGTNTIAVEVHQSELPSVLRQSDLSFDLEFGATVKPPSAVDSLIPPGAVWTYLDDSNYPDTTWREAAFDDTAWKSGLARLGFGIGGESTIVDGGPANKRNPSVLLRKVFDAGDPADYAQLHLLMERDDGAQVYLNGVRLLNDNVDPAGTLIDYALSEVPSTEQLKWRHYLVDPKRLLPGRNLIAVELHQSAPDGADLTFDLQLTATLGGGSAPELFITRTPAGLELSWPAAFGDWVPEYSTTLAPESWTPVAEPTLLDGPWIYVKLAPPSGQRFFRLRK